jgi:ATP-dependent exoDNAse (exonuclease V) alpha subunit
MAATPDLARLVHTVIHNGGDVRLVGDDRQLAAVGAGGVLRDIAETAGAVTLTETVRFTDPDEAAATLRIRAGQADGLEFYLEHDRVSVGDEHTAADAAYNAWAADRNQGVDALLLAATRDQVTALNERARADRIATAGQPPGREVELGDGTAASAGDEILTRHNDRRLRITATDWVKNGDRFTLSTVHPDGAVTAVHRDTGRTVWLPADYVRDQVTLGYAATIHTAQGRTADVCHTLLTGTESREQLYVAVTRGRHRNQLHLVMPGAADEHAPMRAETHRPPTSVDLLSRILDRHAAPRSASTEHRDLIDPRRRLRDAVHRYTDAVHTPSAPTAPRFPRMRARCRGCRPPLPPLATLLGGRCLLRRGGG